MPLAEFEAALSAMVDRMLAAGIPRVVLITPPPVYDEGRVRHQQQRMGTTEPVAPDRTDAHAARYAEAVRALGARRRLPVLDLHAALRREPGWQTALLADGLHFTPAGQALVGRLLVELLEREYPDELRCGVHRARARVCRWGDFVCLGGVDQRVVTAGVLTITSAILTRPPPPLPLFTPPRATAASRSSQTRCPGGERMRRAASWRGHKGGVAAPE